MLSKFLKSVDSLKEWQLFIVVFAYALFIRFPFFFRDYIDRDESTFILMGQSWAEGNLPYTELWDLKPPVTFLFFAVIIYLFGKSFIAIRIAGTLLVAISAFYTYRIGSGLQDKKAGLTAAFLVVILFSLFGSMQGVMSEHISMAFFIPGVYYFLSNKKKWVFFVVGLLFGLAIMSKINIGYAVVFLFAFSLWQAFKAQQIPQTLKQVVLCGLGVATVVFLTFLPYLIKGQPLVWWNSVILAPLAYSGSGYNSVFRVLPYVLIIGLILGILGRYFLEITSRKIQALLFICGGILLSFLQAGKANGHYLLQLYPFIILFAILAFSGFHFFNTKIFQYVSLCLLVLLPIETYAEFANIIENKSHKGTYFNGEGIAVPNYFVKNGINPKNILFFEYHIGYWLLDTEPPTKSATHPSNMLREELFPFMESPRKTANEELNYILETQKPPYIITRKNRRVFYHKLYAANFYTQLILLKHYKVLDTVENAVIYKRLPSL